MSLLSLIHTTNGLSLFWDGRVVNIDHTAAHYMTVLNAIESEDYPAIDAALKSAEERIRDKLVQENETEITVSHGQVFYQGKPLHGALVERIVELSGRGLNISPLKNFLRNLLANPSFRAVSDLYTFLEVGGMPITPDGHFLAYKAVRSDWRDIHSGTFDNSVGAVVEMPRNRVDENPDVTCSAGLHVCSFEYLPNFAHANGHVVVVKINPADVVAIPRDYNNSKMRVCKYVVLQEVWGWYDNQRDTLAETNGVSQDWDTSDDDDSNDDDNDGHKGYQVETCFNDGRDNVMLHYNDLDTALAEHESDQQLPWIKSSEVIDLDRDITIRFYNQ
jgi:hypothetical protein